MLLPAIERHGLRLLQVAATGSVAVTSAEMAVGAMVAVVVDPMAAAVMVAMVPGAMAQVHIRPRAMEVGCCQVVAVGGCRMHCDLGVLCRVQ